MVELKKIVRLITIFTIVILALSSCKTETYKLYEEEFYVSYYSILDSIFQEDNSYEMEKLNSNENKVKIEELKIILSKIKDSVPAKKIDKYEELYEWYEGLLLLRDKYVNLKELPFEEQRSIWKELIYMQMRNEERIK